MQGVLAYVFVRPTLAAIQLLCMLIDSQGLGHDTWGEGKFTFHKWWLWCMLVNNVTQVRPEPLQCPWHPHARCYGCAVQVMMQLPSLVARTRARGR